MKTTGLMRVMGVAGVVVMVVVAAVDTAYAQNGFGRWQQPTQQTGYPSSAHLLGGPAILPGALPTVWMSYNAALRAINRGYSNALWYRGGIESWKLASLPTQPAQPGGHGQQQPGGFGQQPPGGYSEQQPSARRAMTPAARVATPCAGWLEPARPNDQEVLLPKPPS